MSGEWMADDWTMQLVDEAERSNEPDDVHSIMRRLAARGRHPHYAEDIRRYGHITPDEDIIDLILQREEDDRACAETSALADYWWRCAMIWAGQLRAAGLEPHAVQPKDDAGPTREAMRP